jgi:flagellar biosynthetic protein FliP
MRKKIALIALALLLAGAADVCAQTANGPVNFPFVDIGVRSAKNNTEVALSLQLLLLLAVVSLAPSIIVLCTAFLRISIVFDFIKRALSLQQVPPNQVLMVFIMWPTLDQIYQNSFKPFGDGKISIEKMYQEAEGPIKRFMWRQMGNDYSNVELFLKMGNYPKPATKGDVPIHVLIPAFVLHEMTVAFKIGILLFIPFIIIDMVVASTLMSMGMIMLPPVMISMPFKLVLFVLVDGWGLITMQLVRSFG